MRCTWVCVWIHTCSPQSTWQRVPLPACLGLGSCSGYRDPAQSHVLSPLHTSKPQVPVHRYSLGDIIQVYFFCGYDKVVWIKERIIDLCLVFIMYTCISLQTGTRVLRNHRSLEDLPAFAERPLYIIPIPVFVYNCIDHQCEELTFLVERYSCHTVECFQMKQSVLDHLLISVFTVCTYMYSIIYFLFNDVYHL